MEGYVKSSVNNGISTIRFYHPQSNSLPSSLLKQLSDEISNAGKDENIKVIVLRSEEHAIFCAGGSFDEMIKINDPETGKSFFSGFANVINAIRKAPKFVLVRVHGKTVGGGVGITSAADYVFAVENASIKLSELAIGIGPFVIGPAVQRKIGLSAFSTLTINATQWKTAKWASKKGLFNDVFESIEQMDKAIEKLTTQLSSSNPEAMKLLKTDFWKGTENWDELLAKQAETVGELIQNKYFTEAITKFKSKQ